MRLAVVRNEQGQISDLKVLSEDELNPALIDDTDEEEHFDLSRTLEAIPVEQESMAEALPA